MIMDSLLIAAGEAAAAPAANNSMWTFMVPLLVVVVVMTFISSRSQKKQREKQQKMFDSIVKGTKVRTIGGFTGKVAEVGQDTLMIELADKMPAVEILKSAVAQVLDNAAEEPKK
ncbi:MAG: preprotein translocase subunit YajC [Lentisphaerae bacterium]|nr:preprotein translocase subunit YajC [Lentisphaerota bacterium]